LKAMTLQNNPQGDLLGFSSGFRSDAPTQSVQPPAEVCFGAFDEIGSTPAVPYMLDSFSQSCQVTGALACGACCFPGTSDVSVDSCGVSGRNYVMSCNGGHDLCSSAIGALVSSSYFCQSNLLVWESWPRERDSQAGTQDCSRLQVLQRGTRVECQIFSCVSKVPKPTTKRSSPTLWQFPSTSKNSQRSFPSTSIATRALRERFHERLLEQ
jgi:hypothetical protein